MTLIQALVYAKIGRHLYRKLNKNMLNNYKFILNIIMNKISVNKNYIYKYQNKKNTSELNKHNLN